MKAEAIVQILAALGQPTRWAVFETLGEAGAAGLTAGEISKAVGTQANTMSPHLAVLANAGIVEIRRNGTKRNYRLVQGLAHDAAAAIQNIIKSD